MRAVRDAHKLCERPGEDARRSIVPRFRILVSYFPAGTYTAGILCLFTISFNAGRSFDISS